MLLPESDGLRMGGKTPPATSHLGFLDHYSQRNSRLHRLEARTKLLGLLLFIAAVVLTPGGHWLRHGLQATVLAGFLFASGVPLGFFLGRVLLLAPFLVLASGGLLRGGSSALFLSLWAKSTLAWLAVVLLTATTPFPRLLDGLRALRVPGVLLHVLSFAYRYLLLLADEGMRLSRAYAARAVGPRHLRQIQPFGQLLGHFFLRTYDRSERIYQAMLARGFDGQFRALAPPRWSWTETGWLTGFALVLGLFGFL